jgi:hypothetical protein
MKIIHRGVPPSERIYSGRCTSCSTLVEFQQSEATASQDQREPGYYIKCPICPHGTIWGQVKGGSYYEDR